MMSRFLVSKINHLITNWPAGAVYVSSWLVRNGINYDLLDRYKKSGWVEPIGYGAVSRKGDSVDWRGGLYGIQTQLKLKIHVAARTALEMRGYGHYVRQGRETVFLFGLPGEKVPTWFQKYSWKVKLHCSYPLLFNGDYNTGVEDIDVGPFSIKVASNERAVLETIHLVPKAQGYDELVHIMGGLAGLRGKLIQELLENCQSIKVKRVFMVLAERFSFPWLKKVNLKKVDFGSGKRKVAGGGVYNSKYRISLPAVGE